MTRDERIWTSVKFTLLLLFSVTLMYILLCKYVIQIPMFETDLLIKNRDGSEEILTDQKKMAEEVKALKADIDSLNFEIQQVQHTGEIKTRILQMQSVYKKNDYNPRYLYSIQAYKTLQGYFDIRENLSYTISDTKLIEQDLEKIKANI